MCKKSYLIALVFLFSCKTATTYYIVRHAEKETTTTMTTDVPLSAAGKERAEALKAVLMPKSINHIYSTNTIRTVSTAMPLSSSIGLMIELYDPRDTSFVTRLRKIEKGKVLVVGHSNTVDDIVNNLVGQTKISGDLPDSQYGDLFVVERKGKKYSFDKKHFGK
jgi:broad specificity phosphatase PhoE